MKKGPFKLKYTDGKKASPAKAFDATDPENAINFNDLQSIKDFAKKKKSVGASYYKGRSPAKAYENMLTDEFKAKYFDKIRPHARKKYGDKVADNLGNPKKASNYKGKK